ncbi:MAG: hypothetical protein SNJ76_13310 [Fimbriimonadaceae bacterium]
MSEATGTNLGLGKLFAPAALAAIVTLIVCGGSFLGDQVGFLQSYLIGYTFFLNLALGFLGLTLLHHLVRGAWGISVLRIFEAGSSPGVFLALLVLIVPILVGAPGIYPWADPAQVQGDLVLEFRAPYMNIVAVSIRTVIYFALWAWMAHFMRKSSLRQDESKDANETQKRTNWSAGLLIVYMLSVTLATTDWIMTIEPHWFSTIFGAWFVVGGALTAIALATAIVMQNAANEPYRDVVKPGLVKDLGNMCFVFTLLWAYTSFSQFVIIWSGNLPEFITYYVSRTKPGWNVIGSFLMIGQFLIPFVVLLSPRVKTLPKTLATVAILIFAVRFVDVFYMIAPFFRTTGLSVDWRDFVSLIFVGSIWLALFVSQLTKASLLPQHDNRLVEAYEHA